MMRGLGQLAGFLRFEYMTGGLRGSKPEEAYFVKRACPSPRRGAPDSRYGFSWLSLLEPSAHGGKMIGTPMHASDANPTIWLRRANSG